MKKIIKTDGGSIISVELNKHYLRPEENKNDFWTSLTLGFHQDTDIETRMIFNTISEQDLFNLAHAFLEAGMKIKFDREKEFSPEELEKIKLWEALKKQKV